MKRLRYVADREARLYRENKEYLRGFEATADGTQPNNEYARRRAWVWAVEHTRRKLERTAPEQAEFFALYYNLDGARLKRRGRGELAHLLAMRLNISETTLYNWRAHALDYLLLAAVQAGVIKLS